MRSTYFVGALSLDVVVTAHESLVLLHLLLC